VIIVDCSISIAVISPHLGYCAGNGTKTFFKYLGASFSLIKEPLNTGPLLVCSCVEANRGNNSNNTNNNLPLLSRLNVEETLHMDQCVGVLLTVD